MLGVLACLGFLCVLFYLVVRTKQPRRFLLADSFYLGLVIFFMGSVIAAVQMPLNGTGLHVATIALIALASASLSAALLRPYYRRLGRPQWQAPPLHAEYVLITSVFLVVTNLAFSYLVFRNLLGGSLSGLGSDGGLLDVRKMIASGERGYFFPGLVKQVRDVFAPAFVFYLLAYSAPGKNRFSLLAILSTTLLAMFFGGQRSPLLVLAFAAFMGKLERTRRYGGRAKIRRHPVRLLVYGIICVAAMGMINQMLGRANADISIVEMILDSGYGIFDRIVVVVPISNIEAFDFVSSHDYGLGALWLDSLAGLMPGTQTGLANEMHQYLGGSFEGNAVLGLPISTYINFGYIGVALVPLLAMALLVYFDRNCSRMNSPLLASVRTVMLVYLPIAYEPAVFLLGGGLVFLAVFGWVYLFTGNYRVREGSA